MATKDNKDVKAEINKLLGLRSVRKEKSRKKQVIPATHHPIRMKALGKTRGGKQGVAGWRQQYHRPHDVELAPAKVITFDYSNDDNSEGSA